MIGELIHQIGDEIKTSNQLTHVSGLILIFKALRYEI